MKVLHISTHQTGGAALAAMRIHKALLDCGVESRVLTLDGDIENDNIAKYKPLIDYSKNTKVAKIVKGLLYRLNIGMGRWWRMHDKARKGNECHYSYPVSPYRVERHPLVRWADVIHLHWCDDFVNLPTFFRKIKKPIFWTLHDIGIGFGGFHYKNDYSELAPCYNTIEKKLLEIKRKTLSNAHNLNIISLSREMFDFTRSIDYLSNKPNHLIHNCVDASLFKPKEKISIRKTLNLPLDKTILLFVCEYVHTKSKGLELLKQAVASIDKVNITICIVGNYDKEIATKDTVDTFYFGKISDTEKLSSLYSSADYLVVPSSQEVCPQTPLESMACGTPVIVFPTGAMKDYVKPEQGVVCTDCSLESLKKGICIAMQKNYNSQAMRNYVNDFFSPSSIAMQHIKVYDKALSHYSK